MNDVELEAAAGKRPSRLPAWGLLFALALTIILLAVLLRRPRQALPPSPLAFGTLHPHTQQMFRQLGIAPQRVTQGLGTDPASAGIHGIDGTVNGRPYCAAFDLSVSDLTPPQTQALLDKLRGAGFVCWWRIPGVSFPVATAQGIETGPHIHGIDPFVPHKRRLEMQIRDYVAGKNGIEVGRYAHRPDPVEVCPQTASERRQLYQENGLWYLRSQVSN